MFDWALITNLSQLISKLAIFLFIIAGNYVGDLYSCGLRHIFNEYMILKHIIGFFIMLFFVGLIQTDIDIITRIYQSGILYIWYIFIMRAPIIITLITIILITTIFLINMYIEDLKGQLKKNKENKENINKKIDYYSNLTNIIFIISFIISIVGTTIFMITLKNYIGQKFSIYKFLLGSRDQECFTKEIYDTFKSNPLFFEWKRRTMNTKKKPEKISFIPKKVQKRMSK